MPVYWLWQRLKARLEAKLATNLAKTLDAQIDHDTVEIRAYLLRKAQLFDAEQIPGFDVLANELRAQADKLALENPAESALAAVANFRDESIGDIDAIVLPPTDSNSSESVRAIEGPKKRRGRPPKKSQPENE